MSGGTKFDTDKPRMDLLSSIALFELSKVLTFGAKKYAPHDWRKGFNYSRLFAATFRHLFSRLNGEKFDQETGLSHVAHAMACLMFILEFETTKPELDDLYKHD